MTGMINKNSVIPYYHQLANIIINQIDNGIIERKSKLTSERDLCKIYDVSRATVRQALQRLQRLGYIVSLHGKGNYVAMPVLRQPLLNIYSFSEAMQKLGKEPSTRLLDSQIVESDSKLEAEMGWDVGERLYRLKRLRFADNEPVMISTTYLLMKRFPELDCNRLTHSSMYKIMSEEFELKLTEVHESLRAVTITKDDARLLEIPMGSSVMWSSRKSYEGELAVEYGEGITRGDLFEYNVVLGNNSNVARYLE